MRVICQCEHIAHDGYEPTPNGLKGHPDNHEVDALATRKVKTPYGTYTVCLDCASDCYSQFKVQS